MSECIEWWGGHQTHGYGSVYYQGRTALAHRMIYEECFGPPGEMHVRHTCDNKTCVNPEHLVLGTHADNMRDYSERHVQYPVHRCGHARERMGHCRICNNAASRRYRERRRGEP